MSLDRRRYEHLAASRSWPREEPSKKLPLPHQSKPDNYPYHSSESGSAKSSSKSEAPREREQGIDLRGHDFAGGRSNSLLVRKSKKLRASQFDYSRGMRSDASLMPPIRQTASIFKQPVTVCRTQNEGKVKADFKHGTQDKPKQLFWEKRLEGLRACDVDGRELNVMVLPRSLKTIGTHIGDETIVQSVATALHLSSQPVTGQSCNRSTMEKNPGVYINPEQPLVQAMSISEDDIKRQEERVLLARRQLQEALIVR